MSRIKYEMAMKRSAQLLQQQLDFKAVKPLAQGAFAQVFQVRQKLSSGQEGQRIVRFLPKVNNLYAFQREKDLLRYLNGYKAFFPTLYEVRQIGGGYFQLFDFRGVTTLQSEVKKTPLEETEVSSLLLQLIKGLKVVHGLGFIHSDIKPSNILWAEQHAYLIDWTQAIPGKSSYESEHIIGDTLYSPPERMQGQLNEKSDIYSLGCTLYYALTGQHIYGLSRKHTLVEQFYAHQHALPLKDERVTLFWQKLISWMTEKNPEDRPSLEEIGHFIGSNDAEVHDISRPSSNNFHALPLTFPSDPLGALAQSGFYFPRFKQAVALEEEGKLTQAKEIYEDLAFRGYSRAMNNLGRLLEKEQDISRAVAYYYEGFKQQNPYASFNLARLLSAGKGVAQNLENSVKLFEFAAMRGHKMAQKRLSQCYKKGLGVAKNNEKARFWSLQAKL